MDYKAMLKKARKEMPESVQEKERFTIPKIKGHVEGNKTILSNLQQISNELKRPLEHMFKFLQKELATPGKQQGKRIVLGSKVSASKVNEKIKKYVEEVVLCKTCGKPETTLQDTGENVELQCQACGAKYPVKTRL